MEQSRLLLIVMLGILLVTGLILFMNSSNTNSMIMLAQSASESAALPSAEEADAFFQTQDWENSASAYAVITAREPENGIAWYRLGFSLHRLGRFSDAVPAYEKALELKVTPIRTMMSLVRANALAGNLDAAFEWLSQASDAGFNNVPILNTDPEFVNLRADARFAAALARVDQNARPCEYDENARQFDFWLGDWDVYDPLGNKVGENRIEKISNGCALLENWVNAGGIPGSSINYYSTSDRQWHQVWVDSSGGSIVIHGGMRDGSMAMAGENIQPDGSKRPFRGTWTLLEDGRVRQYFEESQDNAETWYTWFEGLYVRKSPAEPDTATSASPTTQPEVAAQPSQCTAPEARQFDFWVGEWEATWEAGPNSPAGNGTNVIELILGDCVVEENFSYPDGQFYGKSHSVWNPAHGQWQQTWVDNSGSYLDFTGGMQADGTMILSRQSVTAEGEPIIQRMVFSDIRHESFEWSWERSSDSGQTWQALWQIHYRRIQ